MTLLKLFNFFDVDRRMVDHKFPSNDSLQPTKIVRTPSTLIRQKSFDKLNEVEWQKLDKCERSLIPKPTNCVCFGAWLLIPSLKV